MKTCSICGGKHKALGLCRKHYVSLWRRMNPEKQKEMNRTSHIRLKDSRNEYSREYRKKNTDRMRFLSRQWSKDNMAKMLETNAKRKAAKLRAIPPWARDELDSFVVSEMYDLARRRSSVTGINWHVDHIVPLRSSMVCGLHCASNLRVIPSAENHSKGNRSWPDMPK